ncbi:hypothetical protein AZE42_00627 [Rhizopogon vesiculosus]|uniref:Uncharacterized protein n=1 Tax=Rhizopogon vesiculosus TaxID=180088 RepID=A0A1J8QSW3_9AGAM|nr:hypothetical protein AZE42_00627 [Rhizopogon vesiculosus]
MRGSSTGPPFPLVQYSSIPRNARVLTGCVITEKIEDDARALKGFTTPSLTSVPGGSSMYFITTTTFLLTNPLVGLYVVNVLAQDLLLGNNIQFVETSE